MRTAFWSQDVTNGCCHNNDYNVHTEERMKNVLEAMKHLGLDGRMYLEWVSAKLGDRSLRRRSPGFVEQIKARDPSPQRGRGRIGAKIAVSRAAAEGESPPGFCFLGRCPSVCRGCVFVGYRGW